MTNVNQLTALANKSGFEWYGCYATDLWGANQHEVWTCTKGKYSGEVLDIYYDMLSGDVNHTEVASQFPANHPHYSPVKFTCPVS